MGWADISQYITRMVLLRVLFPLELQLWAGEE